MYFDSEMDGEDEKKRVHISTMHKRTDGCSEFLGCMSFGIKHLLSKGKVRLSKDKFFHSETRTVVIYKYLFKLKFSMQIKEW